MSLAAILWVLNHSETTLGSRLVLLALADHADDEGGRAFPSVPTIGRKARMSEKGARDALRRLEREGHIRKVGKSPYGTNEYAILGIAGGEVASAPPEDGDLAGGKMATTNGTSASAEPSLEQPSIGNPGAARPRNPIWDVLVELFGESPPRFAAHFGLVVKDLRTLLIADGIRDAELAKAEVRRRREALAGEWGPGKATKDALVKHWKLAGELADQGVRGGLTADQIFGQALEDERRNDERIAG